MTELEWSWKIQYDREADAARMRKRRTLLKNS